MFWNIWYIARNILRNIPCSVIILFSSCLPNNNLIPWYCWFKMTIFGNVKRPSGTRPRHKGEYFYFVRKKTVHFNFKQQWKGAQVKYCSIWLTNIHGSIPTAVTELGNNAKMLSEKFEVFCPVCDSTWHSW